ncbi:hypothetical protein J2S74_000412 [Evansella vedderi]|uniref:Uncharacterized protein n=1 Tax=Evansella vedderi TaxID=38282 RepID=A0ABT9ZQ13_9BACI|nr:hypothetical protein [Evansella vedderi]MDQ0253040.1 hypothetical protein [Evansella vedderi]
MEQKSKKWNVLILFVLCLTFIVPLSSALAEGEERLTVSTEVGFDGKVKRQQGFPIAVTITNNGPDISGDLVISVAPGWNSSHGNIITAVDIPANSERTVRLSLPGHGDMHSYGMPNMNHIRFYEGGWQDGKEVKLAGQTRLPQRMYNEEDRLIGLFTEDPDVFNFLKTVRVPHGNAYTPIPIEPDKVPTVSMGLSMLDAIITDQFSMTNLTTEQLRAIQSWISNGGRLIVGADPGVQENLGLLSELLPMGENLHSETVSTDFFNEEDTREYPSDTVEFITGTLSDNTRVTKRTEEDLPIIAVRPFGNGEVIQLAFSPSDQTFAQWDGASRYWTDAVQPALNNSNVYYDSIYDRLTWGVARATNYFPSSFLPFSALVIVFVVYVLVIFPAIYFILKKMDKREHSWWILPALSLIVCLGIFGFGGKDRIAQPQLNEVTLLTVDEQGFGQGYGSLSLLSNRRGNYTIHLGEGSFAPFPILTGYSMNGALSNVGIRHQGDQVDVLYKDVEYWSIRNVSGPILSMDVGTLDGDLQINDQQVTGTLTNNTELAFFELLLMSGRQEVSLGSIQPGETIDVSFELTGSILTAPMWRNQPYNLSEDIGERRKDELLRSLHDLNMFTRGKPALIGFSEGNLLQASLAGQDALVERLNIIVQPLVVVDAVGGPFTLNTDDLMPFVYMMDGHGFVDSHDLELGGRSVYATAGTFAFEFTVPEELLGEETTFSDLEIKIRGSDNIDYEIYNIEEDRYEALGEVTIFDQPEKYIAEYGHIVIRVQKGDMPEEMPVPEVSLKGEISHD